MIYILIPVFNEEYNIPNLFNELKNILPGEEVFFVFSDDGSSDASKQKLEQYFHNFPNIVLGDGINRGPGKAFNAGFEWILNNYKSENDIVVTMEADCTSDSTLLHKMIAINRLGFDLVLASIYAQGGGFDQTSFFRKLISSLANLLYRFLFRINILTLSSFYRAYSIHILKQLKSKYPAIISESGFICMLEILVKAVDTKARIVEIPMILSSRKRIGASKMNFIKTTLQYFTFLITMKRKQSP